MFSFLRKKMIKKGVQSSSTDQTIFYSGSSGLQEVDEPYHSNLQAMQEKSKHVFIESYM